MREYHLYAAFTTPESVAVTETNRFSRVCQKYVLVYATEPPEGFNLIGTSDYSKLTPIDYEWLRECAATILEEFFTTQQERLREGAESFYDELDRNLAAELNKTGD